MPVLLDTSVLIGAGSGPDDEAAISVDAATARECGRLHAAVVQRGGQPRRRAFDLAIVATANVHGVPLLTYNSKDFPVIEDLVNVRAA